MNVTFEDTMRVGKILKTHGTGGEVLINSEFDLPDTFTKVESIFIMIDGQLVPFFIESILIKSSKTAAVKFEDVDTTEQANELTENDWHLKEKKISELFDTHINKIEWLKGYSLIDQSDKKIGKIIDIEEIPSNTLLEVQTKEGKTCQIPFNEETIIFIDEKQEIAKVEIPEGLLDL
ncbi:MAG: ribosome maturation factor RimM [Bacteroidales bacterium]